MKIVKITSTPLSIGKSLVRIETDSGITGYSEAFSSNAPSSNCKSSIIFDTYLEEYINPLLIGENPLEIDRHWETLALGKSDKLYKLPAQIVGTIDIALWDILGKETGQPIHRLMGGPARKNIPLYWSVGSGWKMNPEDMLNKVKEGWNQGFRKFKIRMDWKGWRQDIDPNKDFDMFKLVREFLSNGEYLGFDANNGYSVSTAIQQGRKFEELGIDHFEEPIPHYDLMGLKQISDSLDVAVSAGEQDSYRWWFINLIHLGNPDILQPDILTAGGPSEIKRIYHIAETYNKPIMPHSPQAGLNSLASLNVYASIQNATRPHEFSTEFSGPLDDIAELYGGDIIPKNGSISLSEKPGLGIEINEKAVTKMTKN